MAAAVTLLRRSPGQAAGALPNLVVIGAQKCGTSALHYYLDLHPEVQMSSPKELCFFLSDEDFDPGPFFAEPGELELARGERNWSRGRGWYESHFRPGAPVRGEATPAYASPWFPRVAELMAETVPDARLIFLVRDPIERIVSHYLQHRGSGREWRSLPEAVARPDNVYVGRSRYASALRPFQQRYPRERILILRQEDLLLRRRQTLRQAFRFLGVAEDFWSPRMERERHPSARKGWRYRTATRLARSRIAMPFYRLPQEAKWVLERISYAPTRAERPLLGDQLRARLLEQLEPEIASIERLTGWDLSLWRGRGPPAPRERSRRRLRAES